MEEYKTDFKMENYKSPADLGSSSCLLLRLLNGFNKGVKWRESSSKFIIWIDGDEPLLLVHLCILILPKANNIPLKALLSLEREKIPQESDSEWLNWALALNCHSESISVFSADCRWSPWRAGGLPRQKFVPGYTHLCVSGSLKAYTTPSKGAISNCSCLKASGLRFRACHAGSCSVAIENISMYLSW